MGLHYFIVSMVFSRCPNWKIFNFLDLKENQTGSNWTLLSVHQLNLWMFSNSVAFVTASAKAVVSWAGMKRNDAWQILKRRERERECVKKSYFSSCPTIFLLWLWTLEFPKKNSWFPLKPIEPCEWDYPIGITKILLNNWPHLLKYAAYLIHFHELMLLGAPLFENHSAIMKLNML